MNDPLDDRLSAFGQDGPVPSLATADAVRARGTQRHARRRTALSGAAAAVLLLSAGGGYALLRDDAGPAVLQQADPSPAPTPTSTPTPSPTAIPPQGGPVAPALLLDGDDAGRALGGAWSVEDDRADRYSSYLGCSGRETPAADAGLVRSLRGPDDRRAGHTLLRYADATTARAQLDAFTDDLAACPERAVDSDDGTVRYRAVDLPGAGSDRVYAEQTYTPTCEGCRPRPVVTVLAVAVDDRYLSYVAVGTGDRADLHDLADAAAARLARRGEQPPSAAPTPSSPSSAAPAPSPRGPSATPSPSPTFRDVTPLVLDVEDADRAEPGTWRFSGFADEGPPLDPCPGGTRYPRDADRTGEGSAILESSREAGGTFLVHQVASYPSTAVAKEAAADYLRAVERCRTSPSTTTEGGTITYEVLGTSTVAGARTTYVRRTSSCDTCVGGYTYYAVQQRDDLVSVLLVQHGEDGDPGRDVVEPFAREAARALA